MNTVILIIDDSALQNVVLECLLLNRGYQVAIAESVTQARDMLQRLPVALTLVELLQFHDNGFEIASSLQSMTSAPVALLLSRRLEADQHWAQAVGIRHLIYRPCSAQDIQACLKQAWTQSSERS